ncbi:ECF RNA polymerase sigma factor SigW [Dyadobacter sp. CECT 9275]|uniref:ECF RNA polymerase sigma factor SigW n=1 Tax=Dyadobacter helix TaxID=2822344 RepID=A0A916N6Z3_9BACT|nr:sigma-70 family RNA polymerase sigma factor [Dyadobacter sp. CECT 9275]CAG5006156.1 ECF RNA polymerase sigma factor SigW [Dyadobacter sp. CECT 9275]
MIRIEGSQKAEDHLLLQSMKNGSSIAFDAIYEKYWEKLYNAAYKRLNDEDYAKDITQDIFLQLWQRREELQIEHLQTYLYTAVRNNVFKYLEKEQRYTPVTTLLEQLSAASDKTDASLLGKEFMASFEALIRTLTPSQQEIFRMRYHEDLGTFEIAKKLNITRKTVQNQLHRSIAQLRHSFGLFVYLITSIF